ncbi:hypothetical protein AALH30_04700 [Blautia pseudococcoides]|uniref:hypothetical protein n=1 Tax=Blautia pseudococcoides TaxID=1796616 RepID=UPI00148B1B3E|nr:hypothetical protein [Blautia pseudococcoides]QJU14041.1 hypothetical protein HL650_05975 [Blautia pseudococcoides]
MAMRRIYLYLMFNIALSAAADSTSMERYPLGITGVHKAAFWNSKMMWSACILTS